MSSDTENNSMNDSGSIEDTGIILSQEDADVFKILVSPDDTSRVDKISGMIAYSQYTLQKHQFIQQYLKENGEYPNVDHLKAIILTFKNENGETLFLLKEGSKRLLKEYAEEYSEIVQHNNILDPIDKIVGKHTKFWPSVASGIVGSFIYSLVIAMVLFIALATVPDSSFAKIVRIIIDELP